MTPSHFLETGEKRGGDFLHNFLARIHPDIENSAICSDLETTLWVAKTALVKYYVCARGYILPGRSPERQVRGTRCIG